MNNTIKIKVCGLTRLTDLEQLADMGVYYGGMIFYKKTPRFVNNKLDAEAVRNFKGLKKTGVFVNETLDEVIRIINSYGLDVVQLHGDESPAFCEILRKYVQVTKVFRLTTKDDLKKTKVYKEVCDYFLFDTPGRLYGGSGKQFNWHLLEHYKTDIPFFLSGGIGLEAVEALKKFDHPQFHAVDINSRFETSPGIKNIADIKQFLWHLNIV